MDYSVVLYNNFEQKRSACIVDADHLPVCFFLNNHISLSFSDRAENTKYTYAKVLLFVYRYFESESISLPERVSTGRFLSIEEYENFKHHCKYKVDADSNQSDKNVVSFTKFSDKQLDNLIYSSQASADRVSASTLKMRLKRFLGYMQYLYEKYHLANNAPTKVASNFNDLERKVKSDIESIKDDNTDVRDPFEKSIPDDIYFKMLEVIKPNSPENPWKNSRLRNQLIIDIFNETGIREGALAKLKISDIKEDWHNPRLMITRTPNDPTDNRRIKAAQKTKAHSSAISPELLKLLKLYINTVRKEHPSSVKHDFVFISEKGKTSGAPLSINSIYNVIRTLGDYLNFKLHPHILRHKWNELFDDRATQAGYTMEQIEDIRKYAMGWTENSKMSSIYNNYKHAMKVHELSLQRQKDFMPDGVNNEI
ncbi:site-specific integrase [Vibrio diazotrophicus]|uniref:site-specific integrase n=1 Tax=Vibrio diazotrophicus TaxID=685 RepID=UPI000C9DCE24|nr:site-specific integrase [Vibrio diazotrophicus]PNH90519.1 site-specific integrase [Vibrio diazotrophicus]